MLLVVCNSGQFNLDAYKSVSNTFLENGVKVVYYFQDLCFEGHNFTASIDSFNLFEFKVKINDDYYNIADFKYIWYIKPTVPRLVYEEYSHEYANFIQHQFFTLREGLRIIFREKKWLNDPFASFTAENKIFQMKVAESIGLKLPKTLITNCPKEIEIFFYSNQRTIVKALSPTLILDHVIYTNEIFEDDIMQIDSAKYSPSVYQELIEKNFELRITVVKNKIFAAKIFSQDDKATSIDWRAEPLVNDFAVRIERTSIPHEIEVKILSLMDSLGLNFGCIDMIVSKNNEYIFLEINPNGQWFFIQEHTGYDIASAIAEYFLKD